VNTEPLPGSPLRRVNAAGTHLLSLINEILDRALQVERRPANSLKHLGCGGLLSQRILASGQNDPCWSPPS